MVQEEIAKMTYSKSTLELNGLRVQKKHSGAHIRKCVWQIGKCGTTEWALGFLLFLNKRKGMRV